MGTADIKRVQFVGSASLLCSAMSSHQEKTNKTVTPVPDITVVTDGEGEDEVVNLEAMARTAAAKLEKDLVEAKTRNERIARKKQEQADCLRKKKEDEDVAEAKQKLDEAAKAAKKVPVQPPVRFILPVFLESRKLI